MADITGEIQKYQNMPYNLTPQPLIRQYLEELDPREGRTDTELKNYLYELSLQIEPRNVKQPPKFVSIELLFLTHIFIFFISLWKK